MFDLSFCQSYGLSKFYLVTIFGLGKSEPPQIFLASTLIFSKSNPNIINPSVFKLRLNITKIGVILFIILTKKSRHKVFTINLKNLD